MQTLEELSKNEHKIGEPYRNENGSLIRLVDGQEVVQIDENTEEDVETNRIINLWRMRSKE